VTEPGSLIAAAPDMLDPNFMHTVVLMCRHAEDGTRQVVEDHRAHEQRDNCPTETPDSEARRSRVTLISASRQAPLLVNVTLLAFPQAVAVPQHPLPRNPPQENASI